MDLAPIILFCYNRPNHLQETVNALMKNNLARESELYVFIDGAKSTRDEDKIKEVENIINNISGFKRCQVYKSKKNKGLANSVINGVTDIINTYGKVIVLEDDIITSEYFLEFMNRALDFYKDNERIYSIGGYSPPINIPKGYDESIYLSHRSVSWGWATWKDRWDNIDWEIQDYDKFKEDRRAIDNFKCGGDDMPEMLKMQMDGKIDSWAIRWCYNQSKRGQYTVLPKISLVNNIGFDNSGVHCVETDRYNVDIAEFYKHNFTNELEINHEIVNEFRKFYSPVIIEDSLAIERRKSTFMLRWIESLINKDSLGNKIINRYKVRNISIYGCGTIGIQLYKQLKDENILSINCFVDKADGNKIDDIECISIEKYLQKSADEDEILIISPFYYYEDILSEIHSIKNLSNIISIEELLDI